MRSYRREDLPHDLVAGIVVGMLTVPQAVAYALLAGLPAEVGLYACLAPMVIHALLSSSRQLIVGPVAIAALMVASTVGEHAPAYSDAYLGITTVLSLQVGLILWLLRLLQVGGVVNLLSHPVISGFVNGAAILIIVSQLAPLSGIGGTTPRLGDGTAAGLVSLAESVAAVNPAALALGVASLLVMAAFRRWGVVVAPTLAKKRRERDQSPADADRPGPPPGRHARVGRRPRTRRPGRRQRPRGPALPHPSRTRCRALVGPRTQCPSHRPGGLRRELLRGQDSGVAAAAAHRQPPGTPRPRRGERRRRVLGRLPGGWKFLALEPQLRLRGAYARQRVGLCRRDRRDTTLADPDFRAPAPRRARRHRHRGGVRTRRFPLRAPRPAFLPARCRDALRNLRRRAVRRRGGRTRQSA